MKGWIITLASVIFIFKVNKSTAIEQKPESEQSKLTDQKLSSGHTQDLDLKFYKIPVYWQFSRSMGLGIDSESYREEWYFEMNANGQAYLNSPRGTRVAIEVVKIVGAEKTVRPVKLLISELDFAKLLGLQIPESQPDEGGADLNKKVSLFLESAKNGQELSLHLSSKDHYAIYLEVGGAVVKDKAKF